MFKDLVSALPNLPLQPLVISLAYILIVTSISWKIFAFEYKKNDKLTFTQKWRAPALYFIASATLLNVHSHRYDANYANINDQQHYDFRMESPAMFMLRSLPVVQMFFDKQSYKDNANFNILANALSNKAEVQLAEKYHFTNFESMILPYPGYSHKQDPLEPLHFYPNEIVSKELNSPKKYNILLVVLESFRSYETNVSSNGFILTPNFKKISQSAIVATNFHTNSRTTVQAEQAILCSSIDFASKSPYSIKKGRFNGSCLPEILSKENYQSFWYHGYTKTFFNREQYHPSLGFEKLYAKEEFINAGYDEKNDIGWGIPDPIVFEKTLKDLSEFDKQSDSPFFAQILTLTNHQPFNWDYKDFVFPPSLQQNVSSIYSDYQKGIYYTDNALGLFWDAFNKLPLKENTILIITADHGVPFYPKNITDKILQHNILYNSPLLIVTPSRKHQVINTPLSHLDIAPTVLSLLDIEVPTSFIGRPFLGKNSTLTDRPIFHMNTTYYGFKYKDMQCLPYKHVCNDKNKICEKTSTHYCQTTKTENLKYFFEGRNFINYLELALEAGYPSRNH